MAFDTYAVAFVGYGVFESEASRLILGRSASGGATYSLTQIDYEPGPDDFIDKWILSTGPDPFDPRQQNVYIGYSKFFYSGTLYSHAELRVATVVYDEGCDPDPCISINVINDDPIANQSNAGGAVPAVGPDGRAYVVWQDYDNCQLNENCPSCAPAHNPACLGPVQILIDSSIDGGANFGVDQVVSPTALADGYCIPAQPQKNIHAIPSVGIDTSGGPHRGRIYVAYTVHGAGGAGRHGHRDCLFRRA